MIKIAIVEDEQGAADTLKEHIARFEEENSETCKVDCFYDGLDFLERYKHEHDVIFMDIEMPYINGMKVAQKLRRLNNEVPLVFVTNMKQFAIEGYSVSALDFILKPVSYYRLSSVLKKVMRNKQKHGVKKTVRTNDGLVQIDLESIYYIEVMGRDIIYHTERNDVTTHGKLKDLEAEFAPYGFVRCNNCYLVNLKHVNGIYKDTVSVGNTQIAVSQRKRKDLLSAFGTYWGDN